MDLLLVVAWMSLRIADSLFWIHVDPSDASNSQLSKGSGMTPILWWQVDEDEKPKALKSGPQFSSELSQDEVN